VHDSSDRGVRLADAMGMAIEMASTGARAHVAHRAHDVDDVARMTDLR